MIKKTIKILFVVMALFFLISCQTNNNNYAVVFKDEDVSILKTEVVQHGNDATPPEDPIKEGHTFKGWSLSYQEVKSNFDVYAQFEINKYTVRFLVEGTLIDEVEVSHGNTATTDKPVTKDGYDHIGWDKDPTNITAPTDLNAVFKKKVYTVTFKDDDVTLVVRNVEHGEDAIPPEEPQKDNFIFDGWDTPFTNVTSNLVVKATYKPDPYTITFTGLTKEGVLSWNPVPGETRFDVKIDDYETGAYSNSISLSAGAIGVASRHTKVTVSVGEYRGVTYVDRYGNQDYSFYKEKLHCFKLQVGLKL